MSQSTTPLSLGETIALNIGARMSELGIEYEDLAERAGTIGTTLGVTAAMLAGSALLSSV